MSQSLDEKLIDLVEAHPCLYDKTHISFKCKNSRADAWHMIGETLEVDENYAMKRWNNLRDKFAKEIRICNQASGSGAANSKQWALLDRLGFLKTHVIPRPMRQSSPFAARSAVAYELPQTFVTTQMSMESLDSDSRSTPHSVTLPTTAATTNRRKRRHEPIEEVDAALLKALKAYEERANSLDEEIRGFLDMFGASLSKLKDRKTQLDIMKECTILVMDAQAKELE